MADSILIKFDVDLAPIQKAIDAQVLLGSVTQKQADDFRESNAEFARTQAALTVTTTVTDKAAKSIATLSKNLEDAAKQSAETNAAIKSGAEVIDKMAKSSEEATGSTISLKSELRNLTEEIARAKATGGPVDKESITRAGELKRAITEAKEEIKNISSVNIAFKTALGAVKGLAAGFEVAAGASALFGAKDEELEKTLKKVTGSIALVNGLTEIQNTLKKESELVTGLQVAKTALLAEVTAGMSAAEVVATVTTTALTIAFNALLGPVGLVIAGIGLATLAYRYFTAESREAEEQQKKNEEQNKRNIQLDKIFTTALNERSANIEKDLKFQIDLAKAQGKSKDEILQKERVLNEFEKAKNANAVANLKSDEAIRKAEQGFADAANKQAVEEAQTATDNAKSALEAKKKANEEAFKSAIESEKLKLIGLKEALIQQLASEKITKDIFDKQFEADQVASLGRQIDIEKKFGKDTVATREQINEAELNTIVKGQEEARKQREKQAKQNEANAKSDLADNLKNIDLATQQQIGIETKGLKDSGQISARKLQIQIQDIDKKIAVVRDSGESETEINTKVLELRGEKEKELTELQKIENENRKKILEDYKKASEEVDNAGFKVFSELTKRQTDEQVDAIEQRKDTAVAKLDEELSKKQITQSQYDKKKKTIEDKARADEAAIKRDAFQKQKIADTIAAIIKTALAVTAALPNPILAAATAIAGAAEVAIIASQPIPKFAKGTKRFNGKGTATSDSNVVMISDGEGITSAKTTEKYFPILSAIHDHAIDSKLLNGLAIGDISLADIQQAKSARINGGLDEYGARRAFNGAKISITNTGEIGEAVASKFSDMSYFNERYAA